jgi:branched-chain amino acid transport system permease protein
VGHPYWWAFLLTLIISFCRRHRHRAAAVQAARQGSDPDQRRWFHRIVCDRQLVAGLIWDFTIKQYPSPFGSSPFLGSQLISTHQAGMIGVTLGC